MFRENMVSLRIRTHVSRVAPDWDLSDALPTELYRAVVKSKATHLLDILSIFVLADDLDLAAVVLVDVIDVDSEDVLVRLLSDLEVLVVHDLNVVQVPAADRLGYVQPYINTCFRIFL